jgi:hypothetical protein
MHLETKLVLHTHLNCTSYFYLRQYLCLTWAAIVSILLPNCSKWIQLSNTQFPSRLLHICLHQQHICQYHLRVLLTTISITRQQLFSGTMRAYITGIKNIRFIASRLATQDSQARSRTKGKNVGTSSIGQMFSYSISKEPKVQERLQAWRTLIETKTKKSKAKKSLVSTKYKPKMKIISTTPITKTYIFTWKKHFNHFYFSLLHLNKSLRNSRLTASLSVTDIACS